MCPDSARVESAHGALQPAAHEPSSSLLLKDCRLVNVYSGEIYRTDITVRDDRVTSIDAASSRDAGQVIDCAGLFAVPGMIDCHMHVDTTSLWPGELARVLVPRGTTTVFVDHTNVIATGGLDAVKSLMDAFEGVPLRAFFAAPSYCPLVPGHETVAYRLTLDGLQRMLAWPGMVSIGETVSSNILAEDVEFLARVALCGAMGRRVSGHGGDLPRGVEACLDAYVAAGVNDDHVVMRPPDILPRLRRGLELFVVESAGRENLSHGLLDYFVGQKIPTRHICLAIDNITVMSLVAERFGYLEHAVRVALRGGLPAVDVFRMVTLNPAEHYRKAHLLGSITPGRLADILLLRALDDFPPEVVIVGGQVVARGGTLTIDIPAPRVPPAHRESIRLHESVSRARLALHVSRDARKARVRAFRVTDQDAAFNTAVEADLEVVDGLVQSDLAHDILKFCVVERYGQNGNVAVGFAQGFGLRRGALASSTSVPANNIVAVGVSDDEIWAAIQRLEQIQGGIVVVVDGQSLAEVRLPIGGVMAEQPYEEVVDAFTRAQAMAQTVLGCPLDRPFHPLASTGLYSLPDLGMTDCGLVDVRAGQFVPVVIGVEPDLTGASRSMPA